MRHNIQHHHLLFAGFKILSLLIKITEDFDVTLSRTICRLICESVANGTLVMDKSLLTVSTVLLKLPHSDSLYSTESLEQAA